MALSIRNCHFLVLDEFKDSLGKLSFVQNDARIPFVFQRMYFLQDVPYGAEREAHAHKELHQLFFVFNGSYRLRIDDGYEKRDVIIKESNCQAPKIWSSL